MNIIKFVTNGAETVGSVYKSCEKRCPYELSAKGSWHWGIRRGSGEIAGLSMHGDFSVPVVRILAAVDSYCGKCARQIAVSPEIYEENEVIPAYRYMPHPRYRHRDAARRI